MGDTAQSTNAKGRIFEVKVLESRSSGVLVKIIDSGKEGFVPQKEISWNRSIRTPFRFPEVGEKRKAVLLDTKGKRFRLSFRRVHDPWLDVIKRRRYKVGDVVIGEVVNVRHDGAYVQLEPGIDAKVYPRDTSFSKKNIEDVLWVGDKIRAVVTKADLPNRKIEISIVQALNRFRAETHRDLQEKFEYPSPERREGNSDALMLPEEAKEQGITFFQALEIKRVLILDDDAGWREFLKKQIKDHYAVEADDVSNSDDAWEKIEEGKVYDLILVDIQLDHEDGRDFARELLTKGMDVPVLLMSIADQDISDLREESSKISFAPKSEDLTEIFEAIDQIRLGGSVNVFTKRLALAKHTSSTLKEIISSAFVSRVRLQEILKWLHDEINPSHCFLVKLFTEKQEVNIVASYPPYTDEEKKEVQDGLFFSPARQIIEDKKAFRENDVDCEHDARYKNFFPTIVFRSFFGVPVHVPGTCSSYALIVLSESPDFFSDNAVVNSAYIAVNFLALTLERLSMLSLMERYQHTYAMGLLLGDFVHEINHRIQALETAQRKMEHIALAPRLETKDAFARWVKDVQGQAEQLRRRIDDLDSLSQSYTRQIKFEYEAIDINELLSMVIKRLSGTETRTAVTIWKDFSKDLPKAKSIQENLRQVFTNLLLNAIQMIDYQQSLWLKESRYTNRAIPRRTGTIIVQTLYNKNNEFPIEVRIIDNGPGIHWRKQREIFTQGISGRGGAGLGLYISRNIIQRIGGRLTLLDSILFEGSVFSVELPVFSEEEKIQ